LSTEENFYINYSHFKLTWQYN